ncbi:MAG: hypothetical protein PUP91_30155 [Rhizonema sp. PD37]|nr:hypothetical protein [Rhizonema sp. PD37]
MYLYTACRINEAVYDKKMRVPWRSHLQFVSNQFNPIGRGESKGRVRGGRWKVSDSRLTVLKNITPVV